MAHRISAALCLTLAASAARAEPEAQTLTEADVVRLVMLRDPDALLAGARARASEAQARAGSPYPNPSLSWEREALANGGPLGDRQDVFAITVPIELSGRRAAHTALARADSAEASAEHARAQGAATAHALRGLYTALALEAGARIEQDHVERLDETERVLARRLGEGTVAGHEHTRILLEAELARSALREAQAEATEASAALARWLGLPVSSRLVGTFATRAAKSFPPQASMRRSQGLTEVALRESAAARDDAARAWIPRIDATLGLQLDHAQRRSAAGYVAGLAIEVPLFSQGAELRAEANAKASTLAAQASAQQRRAELDAARARSRLQQLQDELARFETATAPHALALEHSAQSAYREGSGSLLEVLDAERAQKTVAERRLALGLTAKLAEIALRAARGELE